MMISGRGQKRASKPALDVSCFSGGRSGFMRAICPVPWLLGLLVLNQNIFSGLGDARRRGDNWKCD